MLDDFRLFKAAACFAPPVDCGRLAVYTDLAESISDDEIATSFWFCLRCVQRWWEIPASQATSTSTHPCGLGKIVPLDCECRDLLGSVIPSAEQLRECGERFDRLPRGELRDAAFHLLWFATELSLGREPITNDTI